MNSDKVSSSEALRKRAETLLDYSPEVCRTADLRGVNQLALELAIHQSELELQNDELRDTHLALQDSKDRFTALYEHAPVGYVVLDASGIVRQTNATWLEMLKRPEDDLRGKPFTDAIVDEDTSVFLARFRAFFRNPQEKQIVVRIKRRNSEPFHARIEARTTTFHAKKSGVETDHTELMVIVSDISDLCAAQLKIENQNRELQKANNRDKRINTILGAIRNVNQLVAKESNPGRLIQGVCERLVEKSCYHSACIALLDEAGRSVSATAGAGFDAGFAELRERVSRNEFTTCIREALEQDEVVMVTDPPANCLDCPVDKEPCGRVSLVRSLNFAGKQYGFLAVSISANFICDSEEQVLFTEVAGDLSFALHKIEIAERLAESQHRYRAIFQGSRDGFVMVNPGGRILDANQAFCDMLGYALDELRALDSFQTLVPERWHDGEMNEVWEKRTLIHGYSGLFEKEYIRKDGIIFPVELCTYTSRRDNGELEYLWTTVRDLTERKQMEERLRQLEKMTAIGQLAGGVAHDYNNQLSGIMGYADLLATGLENEKHKRYARQIVVSAQRSADLTQKLLAFSRKGNYLSMPVVVHSLIGEVVTMLLHTIDKRIRVAQFLNATRSIIIGDSSQLQNALLNVALNARDAMPDGGDLTIETGMVEINDEFCQNNPFEVVPGLYLTITVTDTGCGMTDEVKKHLFEPFFTTKRVGHGTGMGLASVYGTVRNHRGAISVDSKVGHGTSVRILLPLAPESTVPEAPKNGTALKKGTARILVVDDEKEVREMAAEMLKDLGFKVSICADGLEAVEYYRRHWHEIELLILDMVMPGMSGRDAFRAMRQINPKIRAVLSSGYSLNSEAQGILSEGVLAFIGKPYLQSELSKCLDDILPRV